MIKKTIVTLSDSNYFPLLEELIHSIRKFKESENINICVLDAGLTSTQIDKISTSVSEIKKAADKAEREASLAEAHAKIERISASLNASHQAAVAEEERARHPRAHPEPPRELALGLADVGYRRLHPAALPVRWQLPRHLPSVPGSLHV